jgi:hypothetical protein
MRALLAAALFALALFGCEAAKGPKASRNPAAPTEPHAAAAKVEATHASASPEHFGAPFAADVPAVKLSALIAEPSPHAGKIVETEGTVSQVCQAAGCWMELADAGSNERVRTPMAGHAFFLPKTVVGKRARVQGRVELIALSQAAKAHLEAEGAQATSSTLSLSALAVAVQ